MSGHMSPSPTPPPSSFISFIFPLLHVTRRTRQTPSTALLAVWPQVSLCSHSCLSQPLFDCTHSCSDFASLKREYLPQGPESHPTLFRVPCDPVTAPIIGRDGPCLQVLSPPLAEDLTGPRSAFPQGLQGRQRPTQVLYSERDSGSSPRTKTCHVHMG